MYNYFSSYIIIFALCSVLILLECHQVNCLPFGIRRRAPPLQNSSILPWAQQDLEDKLRRIERRVRRDFQKASHRSQKIAEDWTREGKAFAKQKSASGAKELEAFAERLLHKQQELLTSLEKKVRDISIKQRIEDAYDTATASTLALLFSRGGEAAPLLNISLESLEGEWEERASIKSGSRRRDVASQYYYKRPSEGEDKWKFAEKSVALPQKEETFYEHVITPSGPQTYREGMVGLPHSIVDAQFEGGAFRGNKRVDDVVVRRGVGGHELLFLKRKRRLWGRSDPSAREIAQMHEKARQLGLDPTRLSPATTV